jgi:hypothetical protein
MFFISGSKAGMTEAGALRAMACAKEHPNLKRPEYREYYTTHISCPYCGKPHEVKNTQFMCEGVKIRLKRKGGV